jgi:hypothetical protein
MKKAGSLVHEAFLLRERERKRQANQGWKSQRIKILKLSYRFSIYIYLNPYHSLWIILLEITKI